MDKVPVKYRKEIREKLDSLALLIQARRKELGYSQEEFAERLDIGLNTLKSIEQKIRYPSLPMLFYLCKTLNIEIRIS